ncbi:MAG: hypothetical protein KDI37_11655 [Xanthomonadales bacterium]|nr:hypothetical protein [Xanthomonadales bacterium]MCB1642380.1 hypothetical protein [Xanthomonadales bacterium]
MTTARSAIAPPGAFGRYHCVARCVRRAWLCGFDKLSGQSYEHRRQWLVDRMNELAAIFAVRVLAYCAMSNHMHLALEFDPAWVEGWSDLDCAKRWLQLYCPADQNDEQKAQRIDKLLRAEGKIAQIRMRLASVSEFMKCLNEYIARRANLEDDVTGRFWEGRFKCQRLLDDQAVLSVMTYIDLNPVRAGLAVDLESSNYTSIQQRIRETAARIGNLDRVIEPLAGVPGPLPLGLSIRHYLGLVDWTGRIMHPAKRGKIEAGARSVLDSLGIGTSEQRPMVLRQLDVSEHSWTTQVKATESNFHRVIGTAEGILVYAEHIGQRWLQGLGIASLLAERRKPPRTV